MMQALRDALGTLSESVLPNGTPAIAAVPHALRTTDPAGSRDRLKGSIVQCGDGSFLLVPAEEVPASCTAASKGCFVSATGDPADAVYKTLAQLNGVATGIGLGLLTTGATSGARADSLTVAGLGVVVHPVAGTTFTEVSVSVGGGSFATMSIDDMMNAIGVPWTPWSGSDAAPPPIPAVAGVPIGAIADAVPAASIGFLGDALHTAMRDASLGIVGIQVQDCGQAAVLLVGLSGGSADTDLRPISSGLAATATPAAATDDPALTAIRTSAAATIAALCPLVDSLDMRAHEGVIKGVATLQGLALPTDLRQRAGLVYEALRLAALAPHPPTPPLPGAPPAGAPPPALGSAPAAAALLPLPGVASLVALAMGRSTADPTRVEAARLLALVPQSAALPPADMESALQAIAAELSASGLAHARAPAPTAPAAAAPAPGSFASLRIAGSETLTGAEVLSALAAAFSKSAAELAALLCRSARRPPPDEFFASDLPFLATAASDALVACVGANTFLSPPTTWDDAAARLRTIVYEAASAMPSAAGAPAGGTSTPADPAGSTTKITARTDKAKVAVGWKTTEVPTPPLYIVSVNPLLASTLTEASVIAAEQAASRTPVAVEELRRLNQTSYAGPARAVIFSDGTTHGPVAQKGDNPRSCPAPLPAAHSHTRWGRRWSALCAARGGIRLLTRVRGGANTSRPTRPALSRPGTAPPLCLFAGASPRARRAGAPPHSDAPGHGASPHPQGASALPSRESGSSLCRTPPRRPRRTSPPPASPRARPTSSSSRRTA